VQWHKREVNWTTDHEQRVGQFNLIGFETTFRSSHNLEGGAQALLNAIQEFEIWCGLKVCVFITARPSTKLFTWGGGGIWEDMCYERRRAEACVDEAAHHALVNAGEKEIV
jgi:hypothetical protein